MSDRPVCLIPARGGSKRFPGKNIALLRGKPLLAYVVEAARESGIFSALWVSTDDPAIAAVAETSGASVHQRPRELAGDKAMLWQVGVDFADWSERQGGKVAVLGVVLPTAALLKPDDLRNGYELMAAESADFVMGVTTYLESPFQALEEKNGYLKLVFGREYARQSQTLPKVVVDSGAFYFARVDALRRERTLYGERLVGYEIPRLRSIDIDEPAHLTVAAALLQAVSDGAGARSGS